MWSTEKPSLALLSFRQKHSTNSAGMLQQVIFPHLACRQYGEAVTIVAQGQWLRRAMAR